MLILNNVSFKYRGNNTQKTRFLKNIDFKLGEGEILGISGSCNADKTALLNMIRGKGVPDCGSIMFDDEVISKNALEILKRISYISHDVDFLKYRTLRENALLFGGLYEKFDYVVWNNYMFDFGFPSDKLGCCYGELQPGEQIKFQLAFAFSCFPAVLLLDDVPECLESVPGACLMERIKECKTSVIVTMKSADEIKGMLDAVIVLDKGEQVLYVDKKSDMRCMDENGINSFA